MGRKKIPIFVILSVFAHLLFLGGLLFFMDRIFLYQRVIEGSGQSPLWVNLGELGVSGAEEKITHVSSGGLSPPTPPKTMESKLEKRQKTAQKNQPPLIHEAPPPSSKVKESASALPEEKIEKPEGEEMPASEEKGVTKDTTEGKGQGQGEGAGAGLGTGLNSLAIGGVSGSGGGGSSLLAEIRRRIERAKRYPAMARARQIEGVVNLSFSIGIGGEIQGVSVLRSSGSPILDEEAIATVRRAAPLPYYPNLIRISLRFNLE